MSTEFDVVIRGGEIIDGTGGDPFVGDVAIKDGKVAAVGSFEGKGAEEIDARGSIVTPGFVDIHTHYDGQATWDERLTPSSYHGVTTAVMGNCGVGFAPCRPEDQEMLISLMEGVEDIPGVVLTEGLQWNWQTFPEYLDALEERPHDIDFAAQVPHGALRVYVMGKRGADREAASDDDIAQMRDLAKEAIESGALGFSTSRTLNHQTRDGDPTPTIGADGKELTGIALGLKEAGRGVLQVVSDFRGRDKELAMLRNMVEASGRPMSLSLAQAEVAPEAWRYLLDQIGQANDNGLQMKAQVCGRPVGLLQGLTLSLNPFTTYPSYVEIQDLPLEERVAKMKEPTFRAQLLSETPDDVNPFITQVSSKYEKMFSLGDPPEYEPDPSTSIAAIAKVRGLEPEEVAYDMMLERDGKAMLYFPFLNYAQFDLEACREMMLHEHSVLGLGDGGAHMGMICDGSFTTYMMTHWTRDRQRGEKLPLPWVIKAHTQDTAAAVGLFDRGLLAPGYKADINIIDYDGLRLHAPEVVYDLPAGGRRLMQKADGYTATLVAGEVTYREGQPTGALPGKLIRGQQDAPIKTAAE